jgi:hypothetical protein
MVLVNEMINQYLKAMHHIHPAVHGLGQKGHKGEGGAGSFKKMRPADGMYC